MSDEFIFETDKQESNLPLGEKQETHTMNESHLESRPTLWHYSGGTDQGQRRENNEDKFAIPTGDELFIVCDGMGGMAMGELASAGAVGGIEEWFAEHPEEIRLATKEGDEAIAGLLREALFRANSVILKRVEEHPHWRGMGTTAVIGYRVGSRLHLANVGDSRAYLFRGEEIRLLTQDHSIAAALERRGEMTTEEARSSPLRNQLTSALGELSKKGPYVAEPVELLPGDRVILCSDGLWDMVEDEEIRTLAQAATAPDAAVTTLIDKANEYGGHDNITVIALFIEANPDYAPPHADESETTEVEKLVESRDSDPTSPSAEPELPAPTELPNDDPYRTQELQNSKTGDVSDEVPTDTNEKRSFFDPLRKLFGMPPHN